MDNAEDKTLSERVIRLDIQMEKDVFTPPNLTNDEWKDFDDLKAAFENNTRFGEKIKNNTFFLKEFFLRKSLRNDIFVSLD